MVPWGFIDINVEQDFSFMGWNISHHIYFVDNNIIKKYSTIGFKVGQYKLGINNEVFNDKPRLQV